MEVENNESVEPEATETVPTETPEADTVEPQEEKPSTGEPDETKQAPEPPEEEDDKEGEKSSDSEDEEPAERYFGGEQVQVDVPDDLRDTLIGAGVDVIVVLDELYGKDSDFTLSADTRAPLDEKFGAPLVDTFLSALKAQNETVLRGASDARAAAERADAEALEWSNELVGGEEGWDAMAGWAEQNLEESQVESFNRAMQSGDKWLQELAIKDLQSKMQEAEGDQYVDFVSGDATAESGAKTPLDREGYLKAMAELGKSDISREERAKAQASLDARRRAGMNRGI